MRFIGIDVGASALMGALVEHTPASKVVRTFERFYAQNGISVRNHQLWMKLANKRNS